MTDAGTPPRPPDDDSSIDELLRAVLDGDATDDERALVTGSADLADRLGALEQVRAAVAAPVSPLGADRREAVVASALAVWDDDRRDDRAPATPTAISSVARPSARGGTVGWKLAATAAAVVVVVALVAGIGLAGRDQAQDTASGGFEQVGSAVDPFGEPPTGGRTPFTTAPALPMPPGLGPGAPSTTTPPLPTTTTPAPEAGVQAEAGDAAGGDGAGGTVLQVALGEVGDLVGARRAVEALLGPVEYLTSPATGVPGGTPTPAEVCGAIVAGAEPDVGDLVVAGSATVQGDPVWVVLFAADPTTARAGSYRLALVQPGSCAVLASDTL